MLTKCVNCEFYVRQTDECCLNCGFYKPAIPAEKPESNFLRILVFVLPFSLIFLALLYLDKELVLMDYVFSLAASFPFAFITDYTFEKRKIDKKFKNRKNGTTNNLEYKEKIIGKRISELHPRGQKIDSVLDKIKQNDTLQLQDVRQKLLSARQIVIGQIARYELQENKIKLARLQNGVSPFVNNLQRLNEPETENGLSAIEYAKYETGKMRQSLTNDYATEFPKEFEFEKQSFLKQAEETEESYDKLREALLSRQATRALEGISTMNLPRSEEIAHAVETFNIQTTLTDFSESFDELEREYKRLKSENEIDRNLLNE